MADALTQQASLNGTGGDTKPGAERPFTSAQPSAAASILESAALRGTSRRWSMDGQDTIRYPIVPVGDTTHFEPDSDGLKAVEFPEIAFKIVYPSANGKLPSSAIYDVYAGLMFLYLNAGFPPNGRVYFSRYQLLHLIGWLPKTWADRGGWAVRPSGRHYEQLSRALLYLEGTRFVFEDPAALQLAPDGERFRGTQAFPILQHSRVADEPGRPRGETRGPPARSMVQLSEPFVSLLDGGRRTVPMDFDLFLKLSSGTPRLLFRLLTGLKSQGRNTIRLGELMSRLGSTQKYFVPARVRQIARKAHQELRAHGVIDFDGAGPEYVKRNGVWSVRYEWCETEGVQPADDLLVRQAVAYGVEVAVARELRAAHDRRFERVLAATTLGLLQPRRSLPGMIVHYTQRGHPLREPAGETSALACLAEAEATDPRTPGPEPRESEYAVWTARERARRIRAMPEIDLGALRTEVLPLGCDGEPPRAEWVIDGLVAMELNKRLGIETRADYLQNRHTLARAS